MPIGANQNILWLQIPMDHFAAMQELQGAKNFGGVEEGGLLVKGAKPTEPVEQFTVFGIGQCKI